MDESAVLCRKGNCWNDAASKWPFGVVRTVRNREGIEEKNHGTANR